MCNEKILKKGVDTSHNVVLSLDHQNNVTQRKQNGGNKMKNIEQKKADAKQAYKEAKKAYLENMSNENWKTFCDTKKACMMLGVII